MKRSLLVLTLLVLTGCSPQPGSESWCEAKREQAKSEWSASDLGTYTKHCLVEGLSIGSKEWCESLSEKPKGKWTVDEGTSYAKHCVM